MRKRTEAAIAEAETPATPEAAAEPSTEAAAEPAPAAIPPADKPFDPNVYVKLIHRYDNGKHNPPTSSSPYLPAAARILWFRHDHPIESNWRLTSRPISVTFDGSAHAFFIAEVISPDGFVVGSGHALEWRSAFRDYVQKAETDAKSRALTSAGFGTVSDVAEPAEEPRTSPPAQPADRPRQERPQRPPPQLSAEQRAGAAQRPTGPPEDAAPVAAATDRFAIGGIRAPDVNERKMLTTIFAALDTYPKELVDGWYDYAKWTCNTKRVEMLRGEALIMFHTTFIKQQQASENVEHAEVGVDPQRDEDELPELGDLEQLPGESDPALFQVEGGAAGQERWSGR